MEENARKPTIFANLRAIVWFDPFYWGFQTWLGYGVNYWNDQAALHHVRAENFDPGPNSQLDQATKDLCGYFSCGAALPSDFFHYHADKKP
jgi:hypothetical protein